VVFEIYKTEVRKNKAQDTLIKKLKNIAIESHLKIGPPAEKLAGDKRISLQERVAFFKKALETSKILQTNGYKEKFFMPTVKRFASLNRMLSTKLVELELELEQKQQRLHQPSQNTAPPAGSKRKRDIEDKNTEEQPASKKQKIDTEADTDSDSETGVSLLSI